ncbi:MAG: DUF6265 family protein [Bacteroidota bacterium]|nr:DUF6265 family protein [Bacteroidota bacterium]
MRGSRFSSGVLFILMIAAGCGGPESGDAIPQNDPKVSDTTSTVSSAFDRPLDKLIGKWIDDQGDDSTVFHEQWTRTDQRNYKGIGFVMMRLDTVSIENLGIQLTDSGTYYSAQIPSQNEGRPVYFKLTSAADSLVFENAQHDFPQRIVYAPSSPTGWKVNVSGRQQGVMRNMQFDLRPREETTQSN